LLSDLSKRFAAMFAEAALFGFPHGQLPGGIRGARGGRHAVPSVIASITLAGSSGITYRSLRPERAAVCTCFSGQIEHSRGSKRAPMLVK
jgi:hypothetical protein